MITFDAFKSYPDANHFKVYGETVVNVSPVFIQVHVNVPWPLNTDITIEQKEFVFAKSSRVVAWLFEQGLIPSPHIGVAIMLNHVTHNEKTQD